MRSSSKAFASFVVLLSCMAAAAGCGGTDCKDICDATTKCGESHVKDCGAYCDKLDQVNQDSGCSDQYDKLLDCVDKQDDICATFQNYSCRPEKDAYDDCYNKYCADHPNTCPAES